MESTYSLGIDIGTTKVAVAIVEPATRMVVATSSIPHRSDVKGLIAGRSEQVVPTIISSLDECVRRLPIELRQHVDSIGVTGQMHGVVLWSEATGEVSHLVTWQDQRCLEDDFLLQLREMTGDRTPQSGYGTATLAWLAAREPSVFTRYSAASTIHDYIVTLIAGNKRPYTDPSDAASFGFFDILTRQWRETQIKKAGIPPALLPEVRRSGESVGALCRHYADRWGMDAGIPIGNAVGDNQASLYGSLTDAAHQVALTIGTGAQLSVVLDSGHTQSSPEDARYELRPYVGDSYIAVVASLTGGRVLASFAQALEAFMTELKLETVPSLEAIQNTMHTLGLQKIKTDMQANPCFSGERYDSSLRGSFTNVTFDTLTIGDMTAALCWGLVTTLKDALPKGLLALRREVVGSGNALCKSLLMQQVIRESFGCPLILNERPETTACGAALLAAAKL